MPVATLRVCTEEHDGGATVELYGELDMATVPDLEAETRMLSSRYDADQVIVDVSQLAFIDVRGVDALRRVARTWGPDGRLTLRGSAPALDTILRIVGCGDSFVREGG